MKHYSKLGLALLLLGLAFACKQADGMEASADATEIASENKTTVDMVSSNAAVEPKDSNRKFVRTADIKFKVKNVAQSTYAIESIIAKHGGFVTFTNLKSNINQKTETKISQDSILETTKYTVDNSITFRVPNTAMDTVLKSMVKEIDFLDNRLIKADDVSIQMLSNKLAQKRLQKSQARLEKGIDSKGKKLNQIVDAEDKVLDKETDSDSQLLNSLTLEDQVNFSTVTLYLYQRETTKHELFANDKNADAYRPNIGLQLLESLKTGWYILEGILAFIAQLWSIVLLGILGFIVYKVYLKKQ
jgi:hypothetical protein